MIHGCTNLSNRPRFSPFTPKRTFFTPDFFAPTFHPHRFFIHTDPSPAMPHPTPYFPTHTALSDRLSFSPIPTLHPHHPVRISPAKPIPSRSEATFPQRPLQAVSGKINVAAPTSPPQPLLLRITPFPLTTSGRYEHNHRLVHNPIATTFSKTLENQGFQNYKPQSTHPLLYTTRKIRP